MKFSAQIHHLPVNEIIVEREIRQRREVDPKNLVESIRQRGLMNPIIVTVQRVLVAGERRLEAVKSLGHQTIPVRFAEDLDPIEAQVVELEENLKRDDLTWKETVKALVTIHKYYEEVTPGWTQAETARIIGISLQWLGRHLIVGEVILGPPSPLADAMNSAGTLNEAHNMWLRKQSRAQADVMDEIFGVDLGEVTQVEPSGGTPDGLPPGSQAATSYNYLMEIPKAKAPVVPPEVVIHGSFLDWAETYQGEKFNFLHCDFPYGINVFSGPQGSGSEPGALYQDTPEVYFALVECLAKNLSRVMSSSGHIMFWYSAGHLARTLEIFSRECPEVVWCKHPLIWYKSDGAGISPNPKHDPRHVYETALLGTRGNHAIVKIKADVYACPTDKTLHPSTKPEPMCKHFFEMLVDEHSRVLDPTSGSGAALRAADALGAARVLGLEIDPEHVENSRKAIARARALRAVDF